MSIDSRPYSNCSPFFEQNFAIRPSPLFLPLFIQRFALYVFSLQELRTLSSILVPQHC
jgi:hypothetical protein